MNVLLPRHAGTIEPVNQSITRAKAACCAHAYILAYIHMYIGLTPSLLFEFELPSRTATWHPPACLRDPVPPLHSSGSRAGRDGGDHNCQVSPSAKVNDVCSPPGPQSPAGPQTMTDAAHRSPGATTPPVAFMWRQHQDAHVPSPL